MYDVVFCSTEDAVSNSQMFNENIFYITILSVNIISVAIRVASNSQILYICVCVCVTVKLFHSRRVYNAAAVQSPQAAGKSVQ